MAIAIEKLKRDAAQARQTQETAEHETTEATKRLGETETALAAAEAAYDADASDANGAVVISARHARDLAALRAERAMRRETEASAGLAAIEDAHRRAVAEAELASAEQRVQQATRAEAEARAAVAHAHPAEAFRLLVEHTSARERDAVDAHSKARSQLLAAVAVLELVEGALATVAPGRAAEMAQRAAARQGAAAAAVEDAAAVARFREEIASTVKLIASCEQMLVGLYGRIDAAMARQRAAAAAVGTPPLDDAHKILHVAHERFLQGSDVSGLSAMYTAWHTRPPAHAIDHVRKLSEIYTGSVGSTFYTCGLSPAEQADCILGTSITQQVNAAIALRAPDAKPSDPPEWANLKPVAAWSSA